MALYVARCVTSAKLLVQRIRTNPQSTRLDGAKHLYKLYANYEQKTYTTCLCECVCPFCLVGVTRRQPHRRSGLATLPSVGAIP